VQQVQPRAPDPPVFGSVSHFPSICYLPPDSALCTPSASKAGGGGSSAESASAADELLVRYYFDATTSQCYPFGVQRCGGNENRFETLLACQNYCRKNIVKDG